MGKVTIGLKKLEMGDVAVDGGMGTSLTQLGATVSDTAVLTTASPSKTTLNIEEQDIAYYTTSVAGDTTLTWTTYDVKPASLVRVLGGTLTTDPSGNDVWNKPSEMPIIEQSIKLTTRSGGVVSIPRAQVEAIEEFNFKKTDAFKVTITATVLLPEKANTPPYSYMNPA